MLKLHKENKRKALSLYDPLSLPEDWMFDSSRFLINILITSYHVVDGYRESSAIRLMWSVLEVNCQEHTSTCFLKSRSNQRSIHKIYTLFNIIFEFLHLIKSLAMVCWTTDMFKVKNSHEWFSKRRVNEVLSFLEQYCV